MRKILVVLVLVATIAVTVAGCSGGHAREQMQTRADSLAVLLENAGYEEAALEIQKDWVIPDSLKATAGRWVVDAISAASNHMSGGDYEDPDDLVEEVVKSVDRFFAVERRELVLVYRVRGEYEKTGYYEDLSIAGKKVFDFLRVDW